MTPEQAIEYFSNTIVNYGRTAGKTQYIQAAEASLNALKRDVKKNPLNIASEVVTDDENAVFGLCPFCGLEVSNDFNYCPNCGQALEWSNDNE